MSELIWITQIPIFKLSSNTKRKHFAKQLNFHNLYFRNEDLRILASDEFGIIPASTRLQVALATIANGDKKVRVCVFFHSFSHF